MSTRKNVSASVVREFLRSEKGQAALTKAGVKTEVGTRGQHHPEHIAVFHKANPRLRYEKASEAEKPTVTIKGVQSIDKAGRMQTRSMEVTTEQARSLFASSEGKRGRLPQKSIALALSALNANEVADSFTK